MSRIVVMGHAHCGGVNAMINGAPENCRDFVEPWVGMAAPVVSRLVRSLPRDQVERAAEEATVRLSLHNLRTFPWIAEREAAGLLKLHGLRFGIADGVLERLGEDGTFSAV